MDLYEIIGRLYANGLSEAERSAVFKEQMESAQRTNERQQETINNQRSSIIEFQKEISALNEETLRLGTALFGPAPDPTPITEEELT